MKGFLITFFAFLNFLAKAQFAPAANQIGTTAISKDSSCFVAWANSCTLLRGYKDIAQPDSGFTTVGDEASAIGYAGQNGVVSLGDGGVATLTFQNPIYNGPGFDFAVFENGFYTQSPLAFLELAFVEVSSDGSNFFRFSATSHLQDTAQIPMTGVDCSQINNLAGKYVFGYGTPFDLEELKNETGLDVGHITHVRVIDVVGSVGEQFATQDASGIKINDPYPTLFASGGFDLDAVGVINRANASAIDEFSVSGILFTVNPNPASSDNVNLKVSEELIGTKLKVFDSTGRLIHETCISAVNSKLQTVNLSSGIYFLKIGNRIQKLLME